MGHSTSVSDLDSISMNASALNSTKAFPSILEDPSDTEYLNSSENATFPSIFDDSRNSLMFFPFVILSATVGSVLIHWTRSFTHESQYSVLTDRIQAYCLLVIMANNITILIYSSVFLLYPEPGVTLCSAFTIFARMTYFFIVIIFLFIILTRLLYLTVWRNVGTMNEDFLLVFVQAITLIFTVLYGLLLVFFHGYKVTPIFVVCSRALPDTDVVVWDPVSFIGRLMLVLGTISVIVLAKERKKLDWLHRETKTPSGLPRFGTTHIGLHQYKTFILAKLVAFGFFVCNKLMIKYSVNGLVFLFPYSISYIISVQLTGFFASIVYPILRVSVSKQMKQHFKRQAMDFLGWMK